MPMMKAACEPVGVGRWPPIYIWINPPFLGDNGLHCVDFSWEMRKHLMNLNLGEPLALLEMLHCLACGRLS
jgi:hypothetical protein